MGPQQRELRRQLDWLMTFRVVIITTLMICTFVIELMYRPLLSLQPFYLLGVVTYAMTIAYAVLSRTVQAVRPQVYAQLIGDLGVVTGFVYLTGGAERPFSFLYLLTIIIGSILLVRRGGFLLAACSWLMYASMVLLIQRRVLMPYPVGVEENEVATVRILYSLVAHLVSFFAVAYLASYLTENLRSTGRELEMRRDDLAQLRDYNDHIIESINSGLLTTDREGRITFANRAAAEITGREAPDLVRRSIIDVLGQGPDFLLKARAALGRERRYRVELDYEDTRARRLYLGFTVSTLRERSGHPLGMIFIFQDLTEIRVLEEEVALKKRMAALGEMAAGVAHELRNPLASISGSVQVLKRDLRPHGEAGDLMDIVIKESKRLDQIIRDFLLFAKPGRLHPEEDVAANFQPFHGSFASGTGLGLAIVYRIIEEHAGRIKIKSRVDAGTEITLHLPRAVAAGAGREERRWTAS